MPAYRENNHAANVPSSLAPQTSTAPAPQRYTWADKQLVASRVRIILEKLAGAEALGLLARDAATAGDVDSVAGGLGHVAAQLESVQVEIASVLALYSARLRARP